MKKETLYCDTCNSEIPKDCQSKLSITAFGDRIVILHCKIPEKIFWLRPLTFERLDWCSYKCLCEWFKHYFKEEI